MLDGGFSTFISSKKACKLSEATIKSYEKTWNHFSAFNKDEITQFTIDKYINYMSDLNYSDASINQHLRDLRVILYWMIENKYIPTTLPNSPL